MKKIALLLSFLFSITGFTQSKSTAVIALNSEMTAQFTLNNMTSKITLVLTGPSSKWSSVGIGTSSSTTSGDVFVYTASVIDNAPSTTTAAEWNTVSNTVVSGKRTVTLERMLTNSDLNDLQMAFDTTNTIDLVWSRSGSALATAPSPNRGSTTANFSTSLGVEDVLLDDDILLYPNPTSGIVFIKSDNNISKVTIYNQTGALIKTINRNDNSNELKINVSDLLNGLYIFELQNESKKTFKKIIVN